MALNPHTGPPSTLGLPVDYRFSKAGFRQIGSLCMLPSVRATALVFAGKVASAGVGFLSTLVIVRALGQRDFGLFSFAIAVMVLVSWLSGGTVELGIVRSFSAHADKDRGKADAVLRVALRIKVVIGLGVAVIGWVLAEPVALVVFHKPEFTLPLRYGFVGALGLSLWGYILATLQGLQAFRGYALGELGSNLFKLGLIGVLLAVSHLSLTAALLVYILVSYVCFTVGMLFLPATLSSTKTAEREVWRELAILSKWLIVSWFCASLYTRLDMLMLGYFGETEALGVYAVGLSLVSPLDLLASALFTVLLPKVSKLTRKQDYLKVLKVVLICGCVLALLLALLLPFAQRLILTLYTVKFADAVLVFHLLLFGPVFGLIGLSASTLLLAFNKPHILAAMDALVLIGAFVGNYVVIPNYGAAGAAIVVLASRAISGLGVFAFAYWQAARLD